MCITFYFKVKIIYVCVERLAKKVLILAVFL